MGLDETISANFKAALLNRLPERMPFWKLLGIEFMDVGKGWARMRLQFAEKLTSSLGIGHGGALFALADSAGSMALVTLMEKGEMVTTIEMKINYIKPFTGGFAVAEATILHCGKKTALGDVEIRDGKGILLAKGSGTFLRRPAATPAA
ncbi:MAG: PaaI family thioesterase [Deltaproteobacteria bacterium]|nr:PaaI family thioesterase [Deltaproteobacteria bacterium]